MISTLNLTGWEISLCRCIVTFTLPFNRRSFTHSPSSLVVTVASFLSLFLPHALPAPTKWLLVLDISPAVTDSWTEGSMQSTTHLILHLPLSIMDTASLRDRLQQSPIFSLFKRQLLMSRAITKCLSVPMR